MTVVDRQKGVGKTPRGRLSGTRQTTEGHSGQTQTRDSQLRMNQIPVHLIGLTRVQLQGLVGSRLPSPSMTHL